MNQLTKKQYRNLSQAQRTEYDTRCALAVPEGSLCMLRRPSSTKVYRVFKHFPPGSRFRYCAGKRVANKSYEIQVTRVLNLAISAEKPAKRGLTTYQPRDLKPLDIIALGSIRATLDELLRSFVNGG